MTESPIAENVITSSFVFHLHPHTSHHVLCSNIDIHFQHCLKVSLHSPGALMYRLLCCILQEFLIFCRKREGFLAAYLCTICIIQVRQHFDILHICVAICLLHLLSVQWITKACQGFGAQRDVASCRKRESREKAKQDIFRSVRGAAPVLLSALGGKTHQRKRSLCPFIPPTLPWPCSALCGTYAPI